METPSSIGRRSRTEKKNAQEEALSRSTNSGNHDRAALQDISNDSPIIGVTMKTPLSSVIKQGLLPKRTPCSGEALLRGQVKILLEKVEEDAEFVNKLSCNAFLHSQGLLAAPTPSNTPQIPSLSRAKEEDALIALPKIAESEQHEEHLECVINRALLFDSPSKSEASSNISSSVTYDGSVDSSCYDVNWSTQVNANCYKGLEEDEFKEEVDYYEEGEEEEEGYLDELCDGFEKITIEEKGAKLFQFKGKHTRFVYNSDDELEGEEEMGKALPLSPSLLLLKGLPVPEGKHLRFHEDE